jgi:hypothetical protein
MDSTIQALAAVASGLCLFMKIGCAQGAVRTRRIIDGAKIRADQQAARIGSPVSFCVPARPDPLLLLRSAPCNP